MSNQSGQSLMEAIMVLAAGVVVIGALTFASISSLRNSELAKNQAQASKLAQEGIERVRTGRDRNSAISGVASVNSWNGSPTNAFWDYQINSSCTPNCYFNVDNTGVLTLIGPGSTFPTSSAEPVGNFRRAVIISDQPIGSNPYNLEKQITVVVTWVDFAGSHQSQLTTYLRSI